MTTTSSPIAVPDSRAIACVNPFQANRWDYIDDAIETATVTAAEYAALSGRRYLVVTFEDDAEQVNVYVYEASVAYGVLDRIPQARIEAAIQ